MIDHHSLILRFLYEPDPDDVVPVYSAIFVGAENYFVEVRVTPDKGWIWQSSIPTSQGARITCMGGRELMALGFGTEGEAQEFFWTTVEDPEPIFMACSL